jgi:hypothetical protein
VTGYLSGMTTPEDRREPDDDRDDNDSDDARAGDPLDKDESTSETTVEPPD